MEAIKSNFSSGWDKNRTENQDSPKKSTEKVDWKICLIFPNFTIQLFHKFSIRLFVPVRLVDRILDLKKIFVRNVRNRTVRYFKGSQKEMNFIFGTFKNIFQVFLKY